MSRQSHTATPRGTRRTIILIAMLAATLLAPSAAASSRQKFFPTGMRPIESKVLLRGADKNGTLHLVVTLRTPGIGAPRSAGGAAQPFALQGAQIRERISARAAITALGGTVNAEYRYIMNGLRVHIPASQLEALRANPHVADVQLVTRYKRMSVTGGAVSGRGGATPSNGGAATEVQAKNVWAQTATSKAGTGYGVKVAVIDTGIDYTHDDFVRNGDVTFPTAKVVAGYDLAGDDYAPGEGGIAELPQPDSDPMDCTIAQGGGHGTHVAGTIAGYGIKSNGITYGISSTERYTSTLNTSTFKLAPGMAPLASLIAIRVFGCDGSTELTADGIEKAVALGANVINLSLGSPYGIKGGAEQAAINAAERAGVTVVIAAGNDGDQPFLVASPSTEDGAISVAALDDRASYPAAKLTFFGTGGVLGGASPVAFSNTNVFDLTTPVTTAITRLFTVADPAAYSLGCPATGDGGATYTPDWAPGDLSGKIVIVRRGTCTFKEKADAMMAEGAVGIVILQSTSVLSTDQASYPPFQGPSTPTAAIPVLMLNGTGETALAAAFADPLTPDGAVVTISALAAGVPNPNYHTVADFSSGGPRWGDLALKPELAAPGVDIVSAASGSVDGNGVAWLSGTSMATPVVAGVAALVKQANPKWTPALIKSALINTAKSVGSDVPLRSVGAGRVNALNAVKAKVTLDAGPNATMSFGMVYGDASAVLTKSQTFKITNSGTTSVTYKFAAAAAAGYTLPYGVTVKVYEGSTLLTSSRGVTVAKGKTKTLTVKLSATVAGQKRFANMLRAQFDSFNLGDDNGISGTTNVIITGTATGKPSLRLPVIAFLRHVERFTFVERVDNSGDSFIDGTITSGANDAQALDGSPEDVSIGQFSWAARDGRERIANGADIKNVGFNSQIGADWFTDPDGDGKLELIINSYDQVWNAALNEYNLNFDADLDGNYDQVIVLADNGLVTTGYADGTVGCFYIDTLNFFNGGVGALYPLDEEDCFVANIPGSSIIGVSLATYLLWDNDLGVSFNVTSYNGGGWDSDETEQIRIGFDDVASGATYSSSMPYYIPGNGTYNMNFGNSTSASTEAPYAGVGAGDLGWGSNTLGWLLWNDWNSGPANEVYEVIAGY
jgi:subtilisin family serine protease